MNAAISFTPRHSQPFTLEQAMALEVDMLVNGGTQLKQRFLEIRRLENSLVHLKQTQAELESFVREDPDGDADGEIGKAIGENNEVIGSQAERVTLIKIALLNKVGEGGVKHMGLEVKESKDDRSIVSGAPIEARPGLETVSSHLSRNASSSPNDGLNRIRALPHEMATPSVSASTTQNPQLAHPDEEQDGNGLFL